MIRRRNTCFSHRSPDARRRRAAAGPLLLLSLVITPGLAVRGAILPDAHLPVATGNAGRINSVTVDGVSEACLRRRLDGLFDAPPLDRAVVGVIVVSLATGKTLYERNADRRFVPASNTKLFTTASALEILGPDRRFETRVVLVGYPGASGEWVGDIVLVGGGDPSLDGEGLAELAAGVAATGTRRIRGRLLTDATLFRGSPRGPGWGWDWEGDGYAAPVSALALNGGRVRVTVVPALSKGRRPACRLEPDAGVLRVENRAVTGAPGTPSSLLIARRHAEPVVEIHGAIPSKGAPVTGEVSVDDPESMAGAAFRRRLRAAGVFVTGGTRRVSLPVDSLMDRMTNRGMEAAEAGGETVLARNERRIVARAVSSPLHALLRDMNLPSDNQYAETFLRHVGRIGWDRRRPNGAADGENATGANAPANGDSAEEGLRAQSEFLLRIGVTERDARLMDGSGLSRLNLVTPRAVATLLREMTKSSNAIRFWRSLPVAGRTGTLRNRLRGTAAEGVVQAKTGTLTGVSALSGRIRRNDGDVVFSLIMNQHTEPASTIRAIQDRFCRLIAEANRDEMNGCDALRWMDSRAARRVMVWRVNGWTIDRLGG